MSTDPTPTAPATPPPILAAPRVAWFLLALSVTLFVACLFFEGYYLDGAKKGEGAHARLLLLSGWMGFLAGMVTWYANPLLWIGWGLLLAKKRIAWMLCLAALLVMLSFLFHRTLPTNTAGHVSPVTGYGLGYWLWVASGSTALAASLLRRKHDALKPPDPVPPNSDRSTSAASQSNS